LQNAICLRSGRDALKAIAREHTPTIVYIPALACDSMVLPFKMYGHTIKYYRLNNDYTINLEYLEMLIQGHDESGIFLYMNYFGITAIEDYDLIKLRNTYPKMIFVEDGTHNLIWGRQSNFQPDYIVASLRKWTNIPDGGLLWANKEIKNNNFSEDISFSEMRLKAQCMRKEFFDTGNQNLKTEYRKIFKSVSEILDKDKETSRMSAYSYELAIKTDWEKVKFKRKSNAEKLLGIFKNANIPCIQNDAGISDLYVTFTIEYRDEIQSQLSQMGIFNTIIWPLNNVQKETCPVAKYTEEHMLAAPCDQRYSIEDMEYIGDKIVNVLRGK
jgi:hypothetical protein